MKIGLQLPRFDWPSGPVEIGPRLLNIARAAEDAGFASLWVMDHFFQMEMIGGPDSPMLEAYTTLGYIAAVTRRIKLGVLITGVIYRYPGILVKTVTTLDVLSGGRAYFGIGAAWYEREARGLGVPFPSTNQRFEQLEETLQIARKMWSENTEPFYGSHFQLELTLNNPQAISQPHPPIIVGGMGEKKTLRFVAQYGDGCNLDGSAGIDTLRHKLAVLRAHCDELGRDYDSLERTVIMHARNPEDTTRIIDTCRALAEIGITHAIFNMPNAETIAPLEIFGQAIIPIVATW